MNRPDEYEKKFDEIQYVRQSDLIKKVLPFSSATLWRMVSKGTFPAPVKLSEGVTAWRWQEVCAWIQAREEKSHG